MTTQLKVMSEGDKTKIAKIWLDVGEIQHHNGWEA